MRETASRRQILDLLRSILTQRLELPIRAEPLSEDTDLLGAGIGLDSIEILRLVAGLEEELGITIDDAELELRYFERLGVLVTFIQEKLSP